MSFSRSVDLIALMILLNSHLGRYGVVVDGKSVGGPNKLLLMLIDGFRWDYFDKFNETELPGFNKLRRSGVSAEGFVPTFPSLSLVNYYSIMTG